MAWFFDETTALNGAWQSKVFSGPAQAIRIYNESVANVLEYAFEDGNKSGELAVSTDTGWMDVRGICPTVIYVKGTAGQAFHIDVIPYGGMT